MTSHGVEISIAGCGADEKDGSRRGVFSFFFFFSFFFHIMYSLLKYKNPCEALAMT